MRKSKDIIQRVKDAINPPESRKKYTIVRRRSNYWRKHEYADLPKPSTASNQSSDPHRANHARMEADEPWPEPPPETQLQKMPSREFMEENGLEYPWDRPPIA